MVSWNKEVEKYEDEPRDDEVMSRNTPPDPHQNIVFQPLPSRNMLKGNWRPLMAYQYILICLFDFMLAPIAVMFFHYYTGTNYVQWSPLTLQGAGMYHLSMLGVLGISTWTSRSLIPDKR